MVRKAPPLGELPPKAGERVTSKGQNKQPAKLQFSQWHIDLKIHSAAFALSGNTPAPWEAIKVSMALRIS